MSRFLTIDQALEKLEAGEVVAIPTETFYGLAVDASRVSAVKQLDQLKGQRRGKPYPLLIPSIAYLAKICFVEDQRIHPLITSFWPGPLTLVLRARDAFSAVASDDGTVGVRLSSHPFTSRLVEKFGRAITATSANPANRNPSVSAEQVSDYFKDLPIAQGDPCSGGKPSTVVGFSTELKVLRPGVIGTEALLQAIS